ncbi:MAG TPA: hypothetical protein VKU62_13270 [Thermoanaerobaculia bacterium]|nr:hypothetical protein [Thermoanaerobaculia bacterium]
MTEELKGRVGTTVDFLLKNFWRGVFGRFKRYGSAVVNFGEPIVVDDFIRAHPAILADDFERRKPHLQALAEMVMQRISAVLPATPVALAARAFRERNILTDSELPAEAKRILEMRRLIQPAERWRSDLFEGEGVPVVEDAWRWHPDELALRDYYANSLLSFDEVKRRGWD